MQCRSCRGSLDSFLDLGSIQLSGYLEPEEDRRPRVPLVLAACVECGLVQLQDTTPRELLFERYWYQSGINEVMKAELHDVVDAARRRVPATEEYVVFDLGANDGTLLARYADERLALPKPLRVAFEPAKNLQARLQPHADMVIASYFPDQYSVVRQFEHKVNVITSIAMFYAVNDLATFLTAVQALLHPNGVWIVQMQDLAGMLRARAFDNVCHEHLAYYSLHTFKHLVERFGLVVTDVELRQINGGSYRIYVQHPGHPVSPHVAQTLAEEAWCQEWSTLERFAWNVRQVRQQIRATLDVRRGLGQTIDLYGASTKANTLLQVCELNRNWLRQAWERSPEKIGRRTVATNIPIVSEETGRMDPPDALLVGIWQFRDAVIAREAKFLHQERGTLIFPLPSVDIVTARSTIHAAHA